MKQKTIQLLFCLAALCCPALCQATVTPVMMFFNQNKTNFTVPVGKVLLVEHITASEAFNNPPIPRIVLRTTMYNLFSNGYTTTDWGYAVTDKLQDIVLTRPLRLNQGDSLSFNADGNIGYNEIHMTGLLIDLADLYAANVGGTTENVALAGGVLSQTVALTTPRPVRVSSQTSSDLTGGFAANTSEQKQRDLNPSIWTVQTAADSDKKFMQVVVKAPESVPVAAAQ